MDSNRELSHLQARVCTINRQPRCEGAINHLGDSPLYIYRICKYLTKYHMGTVNEPER